MRVYSGMVEGGNQAGHMTLTVNNQSFCPPVPQPNSCYYHSHEALKDESSAFIFCLLFLESKLLKSDGIKCRRRKTITKLRDQTNRFYDVLRIISKASLCHTHTQPLTPAISFLFFFSFLLTKKCSGVSG